MKIIISRKGFDSGAGGVPSPIFPNGEMLSLPIPDKTLKIPYNSISWNKKDIGNIIEDLTNGKQRANFCAHLDPDLNKRSLPRKKNWQPIFGQEKTAQGHLRNQAVSKGDLFLFFGLFREVIIQNKKIVFAPRTSKKHMFWGWLQIDDIIPINEIDISKYAWATYHPHFQKSLNNSNTLYFAKKNLDLPGIKSKNIPGAGVFHKFSKKLQLTAENSNTSIWKLPKWMFPENNRPPLSYHRNLNSWEKTNDCSILQTVSKGQEFVFDCDYYPEAADWVKNLIAE